MGGAFRMSLPSPSQLIARLFIVFDVDTAYGLAKKLAEASRDPTRYTDRKVARWAKGDHGPEYETTLELLEFAGWLSTGNGGAPASVRVLQRVERDAEALAVAVDRLREGIAELL